MFLLKRPSRREIEGFLDRSHSLPLSYAPIGIVSDGSVVDRLDDHIVTIGCGEADFRRARLALARWDHFDIGWVEAFPAEMSIDAGIDVAVLIRHLGFWSLNGARVLYQVGGADRQDAFGFAYGTLTNHAESGEELFEVAIDRHSGDVTYRIRAVSWPQSVLTWFGQQSSAFFRLGSAAILPQRCVARRVYDHDDDATIVFDGHNLIFACGSLELFEREFQSSDARQGEPAVLRAQKHHCLSDGTMRSEDCCVGAIRGATEASDAAATLGSMGIIGG